MKLNLGRVIGAILILNSMVWGMQYQWSVLESPQILRVGQSGVIRYVCTFDSGAAQYSTKLELTPNPSYATSILAEKSQVIQGRRSDTIDLLITPNNTGNLTISPKALVHYTPSGAVENTVLGRDNLSKDDILEEEVRLPSVSIRVGENRATLIGDISLEVGVDKHSVVAYEPVHLSIYVRGMGNLDHYTPYEFNISGVKLFREPPIADITPSDVGYSGEIREELALVADKNFIIPPITLEFFDTKTQSIKKLQSQSMAIEVASGFQEENLLDLPILTDYSGWKKYSFYTLLIALGAGLGEIVRRLFKYLPRKKSKQFWDNAKTQKELVMLLALNGNKRYETIVEELEAGEINVREAKKRLNG